MTLLEIIDSQIDDALTILEAKPHKEANIDLEVIYEACNKLVVERFKHFMKNADLNYKYTLYSNNNTFAMNQMRILKKEG